MRVGAIEMTQSRAGLLLSLVGAALCCVVGCAGTDGGGFVYVDDFEQPAAESAAYRLRLGDSLSIMFQADRTLDYIAPISPAGTITVPSGDEIVAVGRTAEEIQVEIEERMTDLLLDPRASVVLQNVAEQPVYVLGEVKRPGLVAGAGTIRVSMALAEAGGILLSGRPSSVMVVRTSGVAEATAIRVDVSEVWSGGDLSQDLILEPYDVVYVPTSVIGKVDGFVELFFNKIAPAQLFYLRGYDMATKSPLRLYE